MLSNKKGNDLKGWDLFHMIALKYSDNPSVNEKAHTKHFYLYYSTMLDCEWCKIHYNKYLNSNPLDDTIMDNSTSLLIWTINLHNIINRINGKEELDHADAIIMIKNKFQ